MQSSTCKLFYNNLEISNNTIVFNFYFLLLRTENLIYDLYNVWLFFEKYQATFHQI